MRLPENNKSSDALRGTMYRLGTRRVFFWFYAINVPIGIGLAAMPSTIPSVIRAAIALMAFAVGLVIFLVKLGLLNRGE